MSEFKGTPTEPVDPFVVTVVNKPVVVGLPAGWYVEHHGRTTEPVGWSEFVIVRPYIRWRTEDYVVLTREAEGRTRFRVLPLLGVVKWKDGALVEFKTVEGSVLVPGKGGSEEQPRFLGREALLHDRVQGDWL